MKRKALTISILIHVLLLITILLLSAIKKKPKTISEPKPIELIEEVKTPTPQPEPKLKEKTEPTKKEPPKEEPKEVTPQKKTIIKEPKQKNRIKKRKIIKPKETKTLKQKIEEKLKKTETITPATTKSVTKKTDLKVKNFPFKWYLDIIQYKIKNNWEEPSKLLASYKNLSCSVSFRLHKDGTISQIALKTTSPSKLLDNSALKAIRTLKTFPPLPDNYNKAFLDIVIEFNLSQ